MTDASRARSLAALALALAATACGPVPFVPGSFEPIGEADPSEVEAVLFLVGDAGDALLDRTPLVHRLRAEVERWSDRLPSDSAVAVVFLGDNIYPVGLRDRSHQDFPEDSARLHAQIWTVSGPEARSAGTPGLFLPGNHDWGSTLGAEGRARLANQARFLALRAGDGGPAVSMVPRAGSSGPEVLELADAARLVLLDTEWWLRSQDTTVRREMLSALEEALDDGSGRPVVVAAHHPYATGGPHAERGPLDPFGLLARAGAVVQDLGAEPYKALRQGLVEVFRRTDPPLVYAAGHDHSLQVIQGRDSAEPEWMLVSGSGSKLTGVTEIPGMVWAEEAPGYMRLVFRRGGRVDLFVERTDPAFQRCEGTDEQRGACLREGIQAFSVGYSARLR